MSLRLYALVGLAALLPRWLLAVFAPSASGDAYGYRLVGENIFYNLCVSLSDPAGGACVPHWGGNHYPGYPAIVALSYALLGHRDLSPLLVQGVLATAAVLRLTHAANRFSGSRALAISVGLLSALSPQQVAWSRFFATDATTIAAGTWILAELLLSLAERRLRVVPLALALTAATFIRYDGVTFAAAAIVVAFVLEAPRRAITQLAMLAVLCAIPLGAWMTRGVALGLSAIPPVVQTSEGTLAPTGYTAWRKTWEYTSYESALAQYPVNSGAYGGIQVDARAFARAADLEGDRARVEALLRELATYAWGPFPPHIDRAFAELAAERRAERPLYYWVWLPLRRTVHIWFDPLASSGWPAEVGTAALEQVSAHMQDGRLAALWHAASASSGIAAAKLAISGYRIAVVLAFVGLWLLVPRGAAVRPLAWMALSVAAARTVFFVTFLALQSRYLVPAFPFLETATIFLLAARWTAGVATLGRSPTRCSSWSEVRSTSRFLPSSSW